MINTYSEFGKKIAEFCTDRECNSCQFLNDSGDCCMFRDVCDDRAPYELVGDETCEIAETCELKGAEPRTSINAKNVYISFNQIERNTEHE